MAEPADSLPREPSRRRPLMLSDLFFRSAGGPLVGGNQLRILRDGAENYPAWIEAIQSARRTIHLDMYIVHNDGIGRRFRDLLVEKAREGVAVRVLYDWFGALRLDSFRFWAPLNAAGCETRLVNPPRWDTLLDLGARDHRKLLTVDGRVAFISGLCIGDDWLGDPPRDLPAWRDTGVAIEGPGVAAAEAAFAENWATWGPPLPAADDTAAGPPSRDERVRLTIVPTSPDRTSVYRYELAALGVAQKRMWLADAYFMATSTYMEALRAAAQDGVDVRLLVPHNSDVRWVGNVSRTLYRRLLSAGVRIFEWNGPMMHAKSSVTDGRLVRVGSTNLNVSSWIGNWELDVVIDDAAVGAEMEEMYEEDLRNATEIVVTERNKVRLTQPPPGRRTRARRGSGRFATAASGSANRVLKDVALARSVIGSAVKGYRVLGRHEASALLVFAALAAALAAIAWFWPKVVARPLSIAALLLAVALAGKGLKLWNAFREPREVSQQRRSADSLK